MTDPKIQELTPAMKKYIQQQVKFERQIQQQTNKKLFKWHTKAHEIISEKLASRKKLALKNDWKIKFYEEKLKLKSKLSTKLRDLIK